RPSVAALEQGGPRGQLQAALGLGVAVALPAALGEQGAHLLLEELGGGCVRPLGAGGGRTGGEEEQGGKAGKSAGHRPSTSRGFALYVSPAGAPCKQPAGGGPSWQGGPPPF